MIERVYRCACWDVPVEHKMRPDGTGTWNGRCSCGGIVDCVYDSQLDSALRTLTDVQLLTIQKGTILIHHREAREGASAVELREWRRRMVAADYEIERRMSEPVN